MTFPAVAYLCIYFAFGCFSLLWWRYVCRVRSRSLLLDSWLGIWLVLSSAGLGFFLATLISDSLAVQHAIGLTSLVVVSAAVRKLVGGAWVWNETQKESVLSKPLFFFTVWVGLDRFLHQFNHPPFGWDELSVWVPKMKAIADGRFDAIWQLGIVSYPPLWPIFGSYALVVDSMMLYLLPVLLFWHGVLVLFSAVIRRSQGWEEVAILFLFLPALSRFAQEMQTYTLYANMPVALILTIPYLLSDESKRLQQILMALVLSAAVLLRTDTIILVLFIALMQGRTWQQKWVIAPVGAYTMWAVIRQLHGVSDEIGRFFFLGANELFSGTYSLWAKFQEIMIFWSKRMWWSEVYWFLPLYIMLAVALKRFNTWTAFVGMVFAYVFFQYLMVPLSLGAGMDWWLGTGWVRMTGSVMLIVIAESALLLGKALRQTREAISRESK